MNQARLNTLRLFAWRSLALLGLFAFLYLLSLRNYLLYHTVAELFAIIIAFAIFVFSWTARRHLRGSFLLFLGVSYLFIGGLDVLHMLAYTGINIFALPAPNLPTQLWIAARSVEAFSLFMAMVLIGRSLSLRAAFAIHLVISAALLISIFHWQTFPVCYVEGVGLTPFKTSAEYLICAVLISAILLVGRQRLSDPKTHALFVTALALTVISELAFTLYVDVYGFFNFLGHFLKIISFYLVYRAIIYAGIARPFTLLFTQLQEERDHLETRVADRTAELTIINRRLQAEIQHHDAATRTLAHRERRFRDLVESANNAILQFDLQGRVTFFNAYAEKLFGYAEKELLGKHVNIIIPPEDQHGTSLQGLIDAIVTSPEKYALHENENLARDGRRIWMSWSNQGVYDEDGRLMGIMSIGTDRTAERDAQRALMQSEERFRTFMEYLPSAAFIKDAEGRLVYANRAAGALFGLPISDLIGKTDYDLWPLEIAERMIADDNRIRDTGVAVQQTEQFELAGHLRTFLVGRFRIPAPGYRPHVGILARDITDLIEAQQARALSERHYKELVDNAGSVIILWDRDGTIRFANPYALKLFGYAEHELLGQNVSLLVPPTEETGRSLEGLADAIINDPDSFASLENENLTRDGRRLRLAWSNRALRDDQGNFDTIMAIGIDRSRQHDAEQALLENQGRLRRLATELALAEERERRRLAIEIHDNLSQTLALAKMQLAALRQSACSDDLKAPLGNLQELLDSAVANTRSITFELSPPVLYQLGLEAAIEWLGQQARQRHHIDFHFERDQAPKPLTDDIRTVVFQAIRELFANMAKHAQARNVTVRLNVVDDNLQVSVEDDGVGFDPATVQWTATQTSGFGLFNIKERLEYVGGSLQMDSAPGQGARFQLTVPLAASPPPG